MIQVGVSIGKGYITDIFIKIIYHSNIVDKNLTWMLYQKGNLNIQKIQFFCENELKFCDFLLSSSSSNNYNHNT